MRLMIATARLWPLLLTLWLTLGSFAPTVAHAGDDISGMWLSDLRDGDVEIRPCNHAMCGYIASILDPTVPPNPHDIYNEQEKLRTRPLCGLKILGDLKKNGDAWEGWVYDPHKGRGQMFSVEVKLQDANTLIVHGYKGIKLLGETKLWTRDNKKIRRCSRPSS